MTDNWRQKASCRGLDPNIFYPEGREPTGEAKAICALCPVQAECYAYGEKHEVYGVFGGVDAKPRNRARQAKGIVLERPELVWELSERSKCGTAAGYQRHIREETPKCRLCLHANNMFKQMGEERRGGRPSGERKGRRAYAEAGVPEPCQIDREADAEACR